MQKPYAHLKLIRCKVIGGDRRSCSLLDAYGRSCSLLQSPGPFWLNRSSILSKSLQPARLFWIILCATLNDSWHFHFCNTLQLSELLSERSWKQKCYFVVLKHSAYLLNHSEHKSVTSSQLTLLNTKVLLCPVEPCWTQKCYYAPFRGISRIRWRTLLAPSATAGRLDLNPTEQGHRWVLRGPGTGPIVLWNSC